MLRKESYLKIIISPAKIQKARGFKAYEASALLYETSKTLIHDNLKGYSKNDLGKIMKIKGDLLAKAHENIHSPQTLHTAIDLYSGLVFKEMNIFSYNAMQLDYMDQHLRILSAFYGILKPSTGIWPYRLDMTMKLKGLNLNRHWADHMNAYFQGEVILNLASKEFSRLVKMPMINIHFKEEQSDGTYKVVTVRAKKARGMMVDYMIENTVLDLNHVKSFSEMGYSYNEDLSSEWDWVYAIPYEV